MIFFQRLQLETETAREHLLSSDFIEKALKGTMSLDEYVAYLCQAYHHVKHTTPLLMAVGSRLPDKYEWLRDAVAEYIEEELGHQEWILNDIEACGYDKEKVRHGTPTLETELMVSYAYDTIQRVNPVGFFGMVQVLEGTSIQVADTAATVIKESLNLPEKAFSYLRSHGALDIKHVKFFEVLMNQIEDKSDQDAIIHSANVFYLLFADVFSSIQADQAQKIQ